MSEFKGKAGTIYTEEHPDPAGNEQERWEVWFEDFCILGTDSSELEALEDARRYTIDITDLIMQAKGEVATVSTTAGMGD